MLIAFTAPIALFLLDIFSITLTKLLYRLALGFSSSEHSKTPNFRHLLVKTGLVQVGYVFVFACCHTVFNFNTAQSASALHLLLLSAFIVPPLLAIRQWRANHS